MSKISIEEAILALRAHDPVSILYVRSSGPNTGSLKLIERCTAGISFKQSNQSRSLSPLPGSSGFGKHVMQGTIPIQDLDKNQTITILISHIIYINNLKVIH